MMDMVTKDETIRFEIIEGDIYYDDPVGQTIGEDDDPVLGIFKTDNNGLSWYLYNYVRADALATTLRLDAEVWERICNE